MAGKRDNLSGELKVVEDEATPSSRQKRARLSSATASGLEAVTPSPSRKKKPQEGPRPVDPQALFKDIEDNTVVPVTPSPQRKSAQQRKPTPEAKQKLLFGRYVTDVVVKESVKAVYKIVKKLTGSIGGNGSNGPIYGELTMVSMQKMVNLMKEHTEFSSSSRFIDVGSGIGKPSFHVAHDPGVEFSYGIEVEHDRWLLGYNCLRAMLNAATEQPASTPVDHRLLPVCMFDHADIREAKSFDPFTHVYMFSIGFPPNLWIQLSEMWNRSQSGYLICYHAPRNIIDAYGFDVELLVQTNTSMHGSKEGHMGYIYKRTSSKRKGKRGDKQRDACDPLYRDAFKSIKEGLPALKQQVDEVLDAKMESGTVTRRSRHRRTP